MSSLVIEDLTVARGGRPVVHSLSLTVGAGRVTALLGANGAGKSSLVLGLAGRLPVTGGRVVLDGTELQGRRPNRIRRAGLAAVPEGHTVFSSMSVSDNVRAAVVDPSREAELLGSVFELFPELADRREQMAGTLSGGQQQMLAIGQALAVEPRYLLVDELSLGLAPIIVERLVDTVARIAATGVGVLLIEQYAAVALGVADRAAVMDRGEVAWSGEASELRNDPEILQGVYLGAGNS